MVDMVVMSTHPRPLVRKPYIIIIKYNLFQNCYRLFIVCITQTDQVVQSWLLTCTKTSANKSSNWKSYNMAHLVTQKIFSNLRPGVFQTGISLPNVPVLIIIYVAGRPQDRQQKAWCFLPSWFHMKLCT